MSDHKVLPFPEPGPPEPKPIAASQQLVTIGIGRQRLAYEISTRIIRLNPAPAPVIPVDSGKRRKPRKSRK